jgi:hypothetical protein
MGWKWNDKANDVQPPKPDVKVTNATVDEHGRIILTVQVTWGDAPK